MACPEGRLKQRQAEPLALLLGRPGQPSVPCLTVLLDGFPRRGNAREGAQKSKSIRVRVHVSSIERMPAPADLDCVSQVPLPIGEGAN